ncbi:hypothetical protein QTJ16_000817 [Diplocarpon rosae]|uniref:Uncharacterized protein n=1 Tax=Diplocarpon rosae TaxID=946125 RepID=A0AAD9T6L0_9HELO|nr:hypothetical protein QTJ16_000817 [Diplocarpon rosae]PBP25157.1 hypothetical protein BUE80_DR004043 [Diplocarpon rosae]
MTAFPPQRSVTSIPVAQEIALKYLSAYLEATKSSPHLLPNARLEPSGPTAGSSNSSITIHNLQRVEAGLRGEQLAPTVVLEETNMPSGNGIYEGKNVGQGNLVGEGWMDLDEYQREQSLEGRELGNDVLQGPPQSVWGLGVDYHGDDGDRDAVAAASRNNSEATKKHKVGATAGISKNPIDKDARKEEKKARLKQEQRLKHKKKEAS